MIELRNLHIGYLKHKNANVVFNDLNVNFFKGDLIGIIGNNGIGKSTLIKTIFGALTPLKGKVILNDKTIEALSPQELSKLVSIVLTEKIGGFNLTVFDVVAAGRIPYLGYFSSLQQNDIEIIESCLNRMGISDLKTKLLDELSDGQRQKVMIAKSLAQQTPIIILDEPTAFLDYNSKQHLFSLLKKLCKEQQITILVSSHDLEILFKNADKILYFKDDRTSEFDKPEIIRRYFSV